MPYPHSSRDQNDSHGVFQRHYEIFLTPSRSITQYVRVSVHAHLCVHICEIFKCTEWQDKKNCPLLWICAHTSDASMPMIAFTIAFCKKKEKSNLPDLLLYIGWVYHIPWERTHQLLQQGHPHSLYTHTQVVFFIFYGYYFP